MSLISSIYVPDEGPKNSKILFVGEAPGQTEESERKPFVGDSGEMLMNCLGRMGITRDNVRLSNLCHYRPQGNKFEVLEGSKELEQGLKELSDYILQYKPNVICALGAQPLFYLTGKKSIHAYRGSILEGIHHTKVIATYHPAFVLRDRSAYTVFDFDIRRVVEDSKFPELRLPEREYIIDPRGLELEEIVQQLEQADKISVDIESTRKGDAGTKHILCIGFSSDPSTGVCIVNHLGDSAISNAYSRILSSPAKKIFHFGTFDTEALRINGYDVNNYWWDTLTAQHILNIEMPAGLDFLTSIYTRQPYYKDSGRGEIPTDDKAWGDKTDREKLWIYNCKDVCVTLEIQQEQEKELLGRDREMFEYEMSLIGVGATMTKHGMPIDTERRTLFEKSLYHRWYQLQALIDGICGRNINVRSVKLKELLYGDFKLPVRRNRGGGITTDEDAIVGLLTYCTGHIAQLKTEASQNEWKRKLYVLKAILEIRGLRQLLSNYIKNEISPDGRIRSVYKYSATDTGRGACEKYIDDTGVNAQTFPRGEVIIPDELGEVNAPPDSDD